MPKNREEARTAMASSSRSKILKLRSSEGDIFEVEEKVALQSVTIKNLVEDGFADHIIPLLNVDGRTLATVIEWCKKHADDENRPPDADFQIDESQREEVEFFKVKTEILFQIVMAANYLDIPKLMDLICGKIADRMKGKKPEAIRKMFHIEDDLAVDV